MTSHAKSTASRRSFLKAVAAAASAPAFVRASALGRDGAVAVADRITMGCIGVGGQGTGNMNAFRHDPRVQVVAVCDVDRAHRERARGICKLPPSSAYVDYRRIIERDDIDTVLICTPDHWHAIIAVAAARAAKDLYCEKPLSLAVQDGRAICRAVAKYGRVLQTGTWRRSRPACRLGCEMVRNGRIGKLHTVRVGVPAGFAIRRGVNPTTPPEPVPAGLDYDMWLGPAPWAPYSRARCHFNFRWILDYSAGYITDWGAHYLDIAQWGNGTDLTGPVEIEGTARFPAEGIYDAPNQFEITYTYANGVRFVLFTTTESARWGMRFEGTEGWLYVESGRIAAEPADILKEKIAPHEIHLYASANHHGNFIDCVLSRRPSAAPAEIAHRSACVCHLGAIAVLLNQKLRWDPAAERFGANDAADRMLSRPIRSPWHV